MKPVLLKNLKKGDFFILRNSRNLYDKESDSPVDVKHVFVRDHFDRETRKYCAHRYADYCNERFFNGNLIVFTDFTF